MSPLPVGRRIGAVVGAAGELMITFGAVIALFAVYSVWWTDLVADRQAGQQAARLRGSWSAPPPDLGRVRAAGAVGFLHVPALGRGNDVLIRVGTGPDVLDTGVAGLYEAPYRSAMPWDPAGNVTLAAHRDGHGARFHDLDRLGPGDPVVVETDDHWYVYRVDGVLPETSPDNVGVIAPVPEGSPYTRPGRYLTLTTCTPVYTSLHRLVVWGSLQRVEPVDARRTPPPELA
ncbi:LPXTG-site transpeptidase (sortase) family protein [Streptomyces sp. TLI_235]|nr:class E sortase [Streptomyces sp. TLI_235]PBC78588.1 LPXTG-site transpeptidase (sortase) family protein [Streptomyces sp. TLI_235]